MNSTITVAVIAIIAIIVIFGFVVYRRRSSVEIKAPLGIGLKYDGSNDEIVPSPAVIIEKATSRSGGLSAKDETGRGVSAKEINVDQDINVSSTNPKA